MKLELHYPLKAFRMLPVCVRGWEIECGAIWGRQNEKHRRTYSNIFFVEISKFLSPTHGLHNIHQINMSKMFILRSTIPRRLVPFRHTSRFVRDDDLHRLRLRFVRLRVFDQK